MNPTLAAHAAAILTILIWGATFTSTKVLLQAFAPIEILFLRFLLGACALLLACPRLLHVRDRRREVTFALAGLCGVTLYFLLENIALSYSTASNVGVLVGISPFLTALLARIVLGESLHPGFFVGFVCAMSGIVCIAVNSNAVLRLNPLGDVLALLAALTWAFYSILTRKIGDYGYNTLQVTRRIFCWGLLFMLPTLPLSGFRWGLERLAQPEMLANLLFLGLGASALCFATWNFTIRILGAIKTSVYIYAVPVVSVITATLPQLTCEPVNLKDSLTTSLAAFYGPLTQRGITPELHLPDAPVYGHADPIALRRVFGNILNNAVKYSDGDLQVTLTADGAVTFSNHASGLNQVQTERLFDRFYTVETARGSTGLGLSIAKLLTEEMGGVITAGYEEGQLHIRVTFPQQM